MGKALSVIFHDVEKTIVNGLTSLLESRTEPIAADVFVATKKPSASLVPYPSKMVIIRSDGGPKADYVRQILRIGVNVWAETYAEANELSYLVDALGEELRGEVIKMVSTTLAPTRVPEDSEEEHRYLTWEVVTKGITL
jgi:hypothetical protein